MAIEALQLDQGFFNVQVVDGQVVESGGVVDEVLLTILGGPQSGTYWADVLTEDDAAKYTGGFIQRFLRAEALTVAEINRQDAHLQNDLKPLIAVGLFIGFETKLTIVNTQILDVKVSGELVSGGNFELNVRLSANGSA